MIQRASGALTYNPNSPVMKNGPEQFDDTKVGPSFTMPVRPDQYWHWYEGIDSSLDPDGAGANLYNAICFSVSPDGHKFPKLGKLISPLANPNWENSENCPDSIVFDPITRQHHLYYHGGNNTGTRRIGLMLSDVDDDLSDGGNWTRYGGNPVTPLGGAGSWYESFVADCRVVRLRSGKWLMYAAGRNATGADIGLFDSNDGITWTDQGKVITRTETWEAAAIDGAGIVYEETPNGQIFHMWYLGRAVGNAVSTGYAWSYDGYRWFKNPTKQPVSSGVNNSDELEAYRDPFARKYRMLSGYFDFTGPAIRGKCELWLPFTTERRTPALALTDDVNRANDTAPPPGANWVTMTGRPSGLHLIGNMLTHDGSGTYRVGNAWSTQFAAAGDGSAMWVKLGLVGATDFSGFSLWIVHANPVGTDVFTIGNGWFVEISSQPGGLVHFSVTPSAGGGGEWAMDVDRATWCQVGDLIGFVFDGDTVNMEHVRGSVKRTILSRLRTDVADDTGVAFPNPFPAGKIAQPYWIALDVMANQGWRIDEVYHGITPTPVPPTFHGRQA